MANAIAVVTLVGARISAKQKKAIGKALAEILGGKKGAGPEVAGQDAVCVGGNVGTPVASGSFSYCHDVAPSTTTAHGSKP